MKQHYYHIITFGCQMNKSDSERLRTVLDGMKLESTGDPKQADVIIMNTCSIRQSAEDRVYGLSNNFSKLKKAKPELIVCITGCMPGRDKDGKLKTKTKGTDLFFSIQDIVHLPRWLAELNPALDSGKDLKEHYLNIRPTYTRSFQAFVTLQTGCNQFCTFCVVPYARGREINRPVKDILDEIRDLVLDGCLEVTLLGQIVNNYIAPDPENFSEDNPYQISDFAKLLWEVNQIEKLQRLNWSSSHPLYMHDEVIDALKLSKQVNYLHLPVQAGNSEVLKRMNRKYSREFYLDIIKKVRKTRPSIAIGTDLIMGFCGETKEQFEDTVSLYKECEFDFAFLAQYSERSGNVAAKNLADDVPKKEKKRRWQIVENLLQEITLRKNQEQVGQTVSVLVDSHRDGHCWGYSSEMKIVRFPGEISLIGSLIPVKVREGQIWRLEGDMIK
jgi:tRNA-2-methylthio-N6-dimethylallyladenosine synthase